MNLRPAKRAFSILRTNTKEVSLHVGKIGSISAETEDPGAKQRKTNDLFFLHNLLGKGQLWKSFALNDVLSSNRNLYLVDLRNHGDADHHESMTYKEMAEDVLREADQREIEKIAIVGHNMGAKVGMTLSCMHPDRVSCMISMDTAPLGFSTEQKTIQQTSQMLKDMQSLNISGVTRKRAIDLVNEKFGSKDIANFIASNIIYDKATDNKTVKWCINVEAIINNIENIVGFNSEGTLQPYNGPSLFVNGMVSTQMLQKDGLLPADDELQAIYKQLFPDCTVVMVEGAGHYVHYNKAFEVCSLVKDFLHQVDTTE